jgi:uncharacterized membrane protein
MMMRTLLTIAGATMMMSAAVPAQAGKCWWGKCGGGSSSGGSSSSSGGSSTGGSSGGATPVPEPEQMALFGMGAAVLVLRAVKGRRRSK